MTYSEAHSLGEVTNQELFDQLISIARQNFPGPTAEAEAWLKEQAIRYGIVKAQDVAQMVAASPITWLAGGLLIGWLFKR